MSNLLTKFNWVLLQKPETDVYRSLPLAIALANKMARQIWIMLTKNEDYKNPMPIMAA
ncbi:hypothetical protein [Sphingopyxis sp.]|uniref:hypothetical protein n=1 Tax=Sphingopyxis sp. TaxID=1908224 RepID=UPI0035B2083E